MQNRLYSNPSYSSTSNPAKALAGRSSPSPSTTSNQISSRIPSQTPRALPSSTNRPISQSEQKPISKTGSKPVLKKDDLIRVFNTALVSTQAGVKRDFSAELCALTESAPFKAVLNAVRQLACVQGIPERQAAEEVIKTFRKLDEIWGDYIYREGLDRLRGSRS
jgi:hypothetical protein